MRKKCFLVATFSLGLAILGGTLEMLGCSLVIAADQTKVVIVPNQPVTAEVAIAVDQVILSELTKGGVTPAGRCNDEDFLRRASLDITGQLPSPREVTLFALDPDPAKRPKLIDRLLASPDFGKNWGRYWRDVVYMPATEPRSRISQGGFEEWIADQWNKGVGWNETAKTMMTAVGDTQEHPETALIFAQSGVNEDIAAEFCRIFLGIQIQCANCHDHPSDVWKREQFHELAAYFPRITLRRMMMDVDIVSEDNERNRGDFMRENPEMFVRSLDRNRDQKVTKEEMKAGPMFMARKKASTPMPDQGGQLLDRLFEMGDTNKDGALTAAEIKAMPQPMQPRRGSTEHYMPDLKDPGTKGKLVQPKFFVDGSSPRQGLNDLDRRAEAAKVFTSPENPWFARAIVNRIWCEMLGEGFYMPVDDLGPSRSARFPEALDHLCKGFVASGHDPKWLIRTVANTATYQRKVASKPAGEDVLPFAAVTPTRLRADVVYNSLLQVIGIDEQNLSGPGRGPMDANPRARLNGPRFLFDSLFGVDPSTNKEDITGNVPQSLFLMNSFFLRPMFSAYGNSRLSRIVREYKDDRDALNEVFLLVLTREPSANELEICQAHIRESGQRGEAFEDILWTLVNSTEFLSKR